MGTDTLEFTDLHTSYAKAWTKYRITDEELLLQHFEDVTDLIEMNKFLQSHTPQQLTDKKSGWRWVARLPLSLDMELAKKGIYKDKKAFNAWKNHPDNQAFVLCRDRKVATTPAGVEVITHQRRDK